LGLGDRTVIKIEIEMKKNNEFDLTFVDVFKIFFSVLVFVVASFVFLQVVNKNGSKNRLIFAYAGSLLSIAVPFYYAKVMKKSFLRNIKFLNNSDYFDRYWGIGLGVGLLMVLAFRLSPFWTSLNGLSQLKPEREIGWLDILLLPVTPFGIQSIVLAPVGEELMNRGILFNYLKKHMNVWMALCVQTVVFAFSHLNSTTFSHELSLLFYYSLIGFVLGLLYEKTSFLISSIVCHGAINYFIIVFGIYWK
jgi:membrane protease YdiL (CAAX protease family)